MLNLLKRFLAKPSGQIALAESSLLVDRHGEMLSDKEHAAIMLVLISFIRTSSELNSDTLNLAYRMFAENLGMTSLRPANVLDFVTGADIDLETIEAQCKLLATRLDASQKELILELGKSLSNKASRSARHRISIQKWLG